MTWRVVLAIFATLLGVACEGDIRLTNKPNDPTTTFPIIVVEPTTVNFGQKTSVEREVETVTVRNDGLADLILEELAFSGAGSFELLNSETLPRTLAPDDEITFDVAFQPVIGGDLSATVTVVNSTPDEPEVVVDLLGNGALPTLEITPDPMTFGSRFIPCGLSKVFTVANRGPEPLVISSWAIEGHEDVTWADSEPQPMTLYQGQEFLVPILWSPSVPGAAEAELVVESNDPAGTKRVPIEGNARYAATQTVSYDQPEELPVNLLFAIDQSCSMGDQQTELSRGIAGFTQILQNANVDWKVGVITGGDNTAPVCLRSGIITPQTPNWQSVFSSAITVGDDYTRYTEGLLEATKQAMDNQDNGTCNRGFRDPNAPLHIIMISDERDQSPNFHPTLAYWSAYVGRYQAFGGTAPTRVHAIVDLNGVCGGSTVGVDKGPGGYLEVAANTGGTTVNICASNWATNPAFQGIATSAVNDLLTFDLPGGDADPSTIEVRIDGNLVPGGWTYDAQQGAIVFDTPPPGGSEIDILYSVLVTC